MTDKTSDFHLYKIEKRYYNPTTTSHIKKELLKTAAPFLYNHFFINYHNYTKVYIQVIIEI